MKKMHHIILSNVENVKKANNLCRIDCTWNEKHRAEIKIRCKFIGLHNQRLKRTIMVVYPVAYNSVGKILNGYMNNLLY
jgi:hypothetical protein